MQRPDRENGRPFFSRQIGLSATGEPIDIDYGGKLSGRIGRWNLGTLAIRQDAGQGLDAQELFVGRVTVNLLDESSIGIIVTDGDPQSNTHNSLVGADFSYQNTRLSGGRTLQADVWFQQSETQGLDGQENAYGAGIRVASLNSRLHWAPEAGRNVFVVFNHNVADPDRDNNFHSLRTDWTIKADYTFRF